MHKQFYDGGFGCIAIPASGACDDGSVCTLNDFAKTAPVCPEEASPVIPTRMIVWCSDATPSTGVTPSGAQGGGHLLFRWRCLHQQ